MCMDIIISRIDYPHPACVALWSCGSMVAMEHKTIHISPELHKKLKMEALKNNLSLRELVEKKLNIPLSSVMNLLGMKSEVKNS